MVFDSAPFWLAVARSNKWGEKILPDNKLRIRRGMMFTSMLLTDMSVRELYRYCCKKLRWTAIQDMPNWMFFPTNDKIAKLLEYASTPACNKTLIKQTVHRHLKVLFPSVCATGKNGVNNALVALDGHDGHIHNAVRDRSDHPLSQHKRKHNELTLSTLSRPLYTDALPSGLSTFTYVNISSNDGQRQEDDDGRTTPAPVTITGAPTAADITMTTETLTSDSLVSIATYEDFEHRLDTLRLHAVELIKQASDGNDDIASLRDKIISATQHYMERIISDISSIHPQSDATDSQTPALLTETQNHTPIIEVATELLLHSFDHYHDTLILDNTSSSALNMDASSPTGTDGNLSAAAKTNDLSATDMQSVESSTIMDFLLLQKKRKERGKVIQRRILRQYQTKLNRFIKKHHAEFKQAEPDIPLTETLGDMLQRREYKPRRSIPSRSVPLTDGMSLPYYGKRRRLDS